MKVKVIGKSYVQGKDGKANYTVCHCIYNNMRVEGTACEVLWVPDSFMPYGSITIEGTYVVDRDSKGYLIDFAAK